MGLTEAVQWWERWQLRVLVLGSLSLQFFLLVAAALRRRRTPPWLRLLTWAAYQGSDALVIYAMATLFTRHQTQQPAGGRGSAELEALWAPVLLLHLGGQDGFTAYSIQDNELWQRHMFTAATQVAIAVYVFRKSWPHGGDGRVLAAAILLFLAGIIKCLRKLWALGKSSISSMAAAMGIHSVLVQEHQRDDISSIQDFVQEASLVYASKQEVVQGSPSSGKEVTHHLFVDLPSPYSIRLNLLKHVWHKKASGAHLLVRSGLSRTFDRLYTAGGDSGCYHVGALVRALLVLLLASSMAIVMVATTTGRSRGAYDLDADLKVSYILLCCTAGIEVGSAVTMAYFRYKAESPPWHDEVAQCNLIGYLVDNEAHWWVRRLAAVLGCHAYFDWLWCTTPSRTTRPSTSSSSSSADISIADQSKKPPNGDTSNSKLSSSSSDDIGITVLIYAHIADQWKEPQPEGGDTQPQKKHYIKDRATYYSFSDSRGQWTLDKEGIADGAVSRSSVQRPFDESVMVWHLATDMCFFHSVGDDHIWERLKHQCRAISNYMVYLLLVKPEMLMPGARRRIFKIAYHQVREAIVDGESPKDQEDDVLLTDKKEMPLPPGGNQDIVRMLIQKVMGRTMKTTKDDGAGNGIDPPPPSSQSPVHGAGNGIDPLPPSSQSLAHDDAGIGQPPASSRSLVDDALALAEELMKLKEEEKIWRVIRGVWVEMLCFSASRCRGYLHAKSLATGGEFLSYVWLLRAYMGMETLAHTMQAAEVGDLGAAQPSTPDTGGDHV